MNKEELKRRINRRIDEDEEYAEDFEMALDMANEAWLLELIADVIGYLIEATWSWLQSLFW